MKLSKEEVQKIVSTDLGDEYLVIESAHEADSEVEFLPADAVSVPSPKANQAARKGPAHIADDEEIVMIEPRQATQSSWDRNAAPKAVVLSNSKKRVIGVQG